MLNDVRHLIHYVLKAKKKSTNQVNLHGNMIENRALEDTFDMKCTDSNAFQGALK